MCGIAGFASWHPLEDKATSLITRMMDTIQHRGPDGGGYWLDKDHGVVFGHRRLAIVDLSPAGHQPMISDSTRYVISFNGEIYNHDDIRAEIRAAGKEPRYNGHSDTETLLAGFDVFGVEDTIQRASGMFALAIWDRKDKVLTLARDRLGEKPLYYGWQGTGREAVFLFGSELKALRAHPAFEGRIHRDALALLLRHNCIGHTYSIYEGISKLEPGKILTLNFEACEPRITEYWSAHECYAKGLASPFIGSEEDAVAQLETLLKDAIRSQMMADVPLGAFLSGGVDSSTIVALMQEQSTQKVKTFSIGFEEKSYDEAPYARAVANHLGTDHTELYVTHKQALDVVPKLPTLFDEPFADSSQIPTYLVAKLARQHVTVSLSGDAGDELFCGYRRYQITAKLWNKLKLIPQPLRQMIGASLQTISPNGWDLMYAAASKLPFVPDDLGNVGDKVHKGANLLGKKSVEELYYGMVSHWSSPCNMLVNAQEPPTLLTGKRPQLAGLDPIQTMMALDLVTYLPDDILVKVDRAAMGVSLESRVPYLDPRIVEFAWHLPQNYKLRNGVTKWPLRQILYRRVPKGLIERPKAGFGVPLDHWLRGPLKAWAGDLLSTDRLKKQGYFNAPLVEEKWMEHLSGKRNWGYHLWDILVFQQWLDEQKP
ncbi:MAG: asparagine synthase (glutamine-hydrolyzing) [Alphaproteobacteria bacterium]|jgi:asparagine synthase (glutamine-hydrolysing)|nr:asparagine synthase (glutamine-hydrolyzing) [Alphaproteobacteria bacterium]